VDGTLFDAKSINVSAISSGLGYYVGRKWDNVNFIDGQILSCTNIRQGVK